MNVALPVLEIAAPVCVGATILCMLYAMTMAANRTGSRVSRSSAGWILMNFFDADIGKGRFRRFWANCLQAAVTLKWPDDSAGGPDSDADEVLEGAVAVAVVLLPMVLLRTYAWLFAD